MKKHPAQYNRIKAALAEAGVSNKELAEALGASPNTVSLWCTNRRQPFIEDLFRIANYLKIDVRDLLVANDYGRPGK